VYRRNDRESVEVEVVPTFRTPHVTLARIELDSLVTALLKCEHRRVQNPYFDG